jgi:hypothetical protein
MCAYPSMGVSRIRVVLVHAGLDRCFRGGIFQERPLIVWPQYYLVLRKKISNIPRAKNDCCYSLHLPKRKERERDCC